MSRASAGASCSSGVTCPEPGTVTADPSGRWSAASLASDIVAMKSFSTVTNSVGAVTRGSSGERSDRSNDIDRVVDRIIPAGPFEENPVTAPVAGNAPIGTIRKPSRWQAVPHGCQRG